MTYFPDLSDYSYSTGRKVTNVRNVGWLQKGRDFEVWSAPNGDEFAQELLANLQYTIVAQMRGFHVCELCGDSKWNLPIPVGTRKLVLGSAECWYPACFGLMYAAPTLIVHYVREHNYCPPKEFVEAVKRFSALEIKPDIADLYRSLAS